MYNVRYILTSNINNKISAKMGKKELVGQATDDQIKEWKNKYGKVYAITADDHTCYIRHPHRHELSMCLAQIGRDPLGATEKLLQACWLDGSLEMRKDDDKFMVVHREIQGITGNADGELKKL